VKPEAKLQVAGRSPVRNGRLAEGWKLHPFVQELGKPHLEKLEQCATMTEFKAGQVIVHESEIANRFYLVLEGHIEVRMVVPDRGSVPMDSIFNGDVLVWSWLFQPYGMHFSARALEATRAIFFYGTWLREQCEMDHGFGYEMVKRMALVMMKRLEALQRHIGHSREN
jgi:CRP-like cAMP-binding protein